MAAFKPIVLDNGSGSIKAGFAEQEEPQCIIPTVVGRPKDQAVQQELGNKDFFVGGDAQAKAERLKLSNPIEQGVVANWDDMEKIWEHIFSNELKINPKEHPVLNTEPPKNPRKNREKMVQTMFEKFQVPATYVSVQAVLSMYSTGRFTGLVLDSGHGVTHCVPIYENHLLSPGVKRLDFSGQDLTQYLQKLLSEKNGDKFSSLDTVRGVKEQLCYVAAHYKTEKSGFEAKPDSIEKSYQLPDGTSVTIGGERFQCPEALFDSKLIEKDFDGLHKVVYDSIMACDIDVRAKLFENIIVSGGNAMFSGLGDRLKKELSPLVPGNTKVKVITANRFSSFIGGSQVTSMDTFNEHWITKAEYEEAGASIVHRKCNYV